MREEKQIVFLLHFVSESIALFFFFLFIFGFKQKEPTRNHLTISKLSHSRLHQSISHPFSQTASSKTARFLHHDCDRYASSFDDLCICRVYCTDSSSLIRFHSRKNLSGKCQRDILIFNSNQTMPRMCFH